MTSEKTFYFQYNKRKMHFSVDCTLTYFFLDYFTMKSFFMLKLESCTNITC